ncbi:hypothetical protein [Caballeronia sp. NCTM1]|uniref:hypothetical protein n=1 Tax=Caballeronia sp. NCTM1 TaxID=2921753 RepID=UPI002028AC58|nr:hypothetical protein [Caballeronia sp. NCTM1]
MTDKIKYFLEAWEMNGVGNTVAKVQDGPGTVVTITVDDLRALLAAGASEGQAEPVAWLIDWPDEPDLGHYFAEAPVDPLYGRSIPLYAHRWTGDAEPVAWTNDCELDFISHGGATGAIWPKQEEGAEIPLYLHPSAEIAALRKERDHWKANHDAQVSRARLLIERTDLPLERVRAYEELAALRERIAGMEKDAERMSALCDELDRNRRNVRYDGMPIWDAMCDAIGADLDGNAFRRAIDAAIAKEKQGK